MSKFNTSNADMNKTTNRCGDPAYVMSLKEKLVTQVLTTFVGEQKYYGDTDNEMIKTAISLSSVEPEFIAKLTCYVRNVANLRSVSHLLASIIAREKDTKKYTRQVLRNIIIRPDDILEIMACYYNLYSDQKVTKPNGKEYQKVKWANPLKREIANILQNFNEYSIAKYNGGNKSVKFKDVLRIVHPTPKDEATSILFKKILEDNLETPYTWETELSAKGNTKEVWTELINSKKLGYMALLRNLKNIIKSGADYTSVLEFISNPEQVKQSKQLPFRFYAAYKTLVNNDIKDKQVLDALEKAIESSIGNFEVIPGKTLIAIDVSGSMGSPVSNKSDIDCFEIGALLGILLNRLTEDSEVVYFNAADGWSSSNNDFCKKGYIVKRYGKFDNILESIREIKCGGGTDMSLPLQYALGNEEKHKSKRPFDRVIYLSDNECNRGTKTIQTLADKYRNAYNKEFWVHAIDLQGYGTQQFCGNKFNLMSGWNEKQLEFINLSEKGFGSLIESIENYQMKP